MMVIMIIFLYGLVFGSFLNVVGLRWVKDEKITGRSKCPSCGYTLKAKNLIPLVSYVIQKGKCTECNQRISKQYPLMEFITGMSFVLVYLVSGISLEFIVGILFMVELIITTVTDYTEGYVLDKVVIPPTIVITILTIMQGKWVNLVGALVILILLIIAVKLGKMGSGDVLIIASVFLVYDIFYAPIVMFITSIITLIYMLSHKKKKVPFIPFWLIGSMLTHILMLTGVVERII